MRFARQKLLQLGVTAIAITLVILSGQSAWSQATRTIKVVVPVSPGGVLDAIANLLGVRLLAEKFATYRTARQARSVHIVSQPLRPQTAS
jgi:tripartite-type tricarboxylate transporter receptor subunit TctC